MKNYIVKGLIRERVNYGKRGQVRKGSYQFLPNTEIVLADSNIMYNPKIQNRFLVRGKNKSGLLTTKGIYFKYLTDLRIEEVVDPSPKTLRFIQKNSLLYFNDSQKEEVLDWLNYFEELSIAERLTDEMSDDTYIQARQFVELMQTEIKKDDPTKLIRDFIKFPINIRHFGSPKNIESVNEDVFNKEVRDYFLNDVCNSILLTNLDTIFPTEKKMLIGNIEVSINNNTFEISQIIHAQRYGV